MFHYGTIIAIFVDDTTSSANSAHWQIVLRRWYLQQISIP